MLRQLIVKADGTPGHNTNVWCPVCGFMAPWNQAAQTGWAEDDSEQPRRRYLCPRCQAKTPEIVMATVVTKKRHRRTKEEMLRSRLPPSAEPDAVKPSSIATVPIKPIEPVEPVKKKRHRRTKAEMALARATKPDET